MSVSIHMQQEEMSEEEMSELIRLARKFFIWRRGNYESESDDMLPVAWLEGSFDEAEDGIDTLKIVISNNPNLFEELHENITEFEFEFDE